MGRRTVAFVATHETGHFMRLRALIAHVVAEGWEARVFTNDRFRAAVEAVGGIFHDLYGPCPLAEADDESIPNAVRHVTHAGRYADEVAAMFGAVRPALVIYDSFAVVGQVAARVLGLPHVCVCSGHNLHPERFRERIHKDVQVRISPRCEEAVHILRERYGFEEAAPFCYMSSLSPQLNIYCEPEEYIDAELRAAYAPVAFFGSLWPQATPAPSASAFPPGRRKVYVSFGTVVWRFFAAQAIPALETITAALARRPDTSVLVSLGGYAGEVPDLTRENVRVMSYVDQWAVLNEADLFVTHHGLNSTHEAAYQQVPMLSYPFFWDQPALAAKCAALGIAAPLATEARAPLREEDVDRALAEIDARPGALRARLQEARGWEERVLAGRAEVTRRILDLATR